MGSRWPPTTPPPLTHTTFNLKITSPLPTLRVNYSLPDVAGSCYLCSVSFFLQSKVWTKLSSVSPHLRDVWGAVLTPDTSSTLCSTAFSWISPAVSPCSQSWIRPEGCMDAHMTSDLHKTYPRLLIYTAVLHQTCRQRIRASKVHSVIFNPAHF